MQKEKGLAANRGLILLLWMERITRQILFEGLMSFPPLWVTVTGFILWVESSPTWRFPLILLSYCPHTIPQHLQPAMCSISCRSVACFEKGEAGELIYPELLSSWCRNKLQFLDRHSVYSATEIIWQYTLNFTQIQHKGGITCLPAASLKWSTRSVPFSEADLHAFALLFLWRSPWGCNKKPYQKVCWSVLHRILTNVINKILNRAPQMWAQRSTRRMGSHFTEHLLPPLSLLSKPDHRPCVCVCTYVYTHTLKVWYEQFSCAWVIIKPPMKLDFIGLRRAYCV